MKKEIIHIRYFMYIKGVCFCGFESMSKATYFINKMIEKGYKNNDFEIRIYQTVITEEIINL